MAITPEQQTASSQVKKSRLVQRVLIVDDEAAILFAYRKLFEKEGKRVDACETLEEAVDLIKSYPYCAVIADMRLNGTGSTDGMELLRLIHKLRPAAVVIIITGYGSSEIEQEALDLGATYYFEKPVMPSVILGALNAV